MAAAETRHGHSLALERRLAAAPAAVWRAWTDPQALMRWFAPTDDFRTPTVECDVRVGGRYRIVMIAPDGEAHEVRGEYREVVPNERLVFTWAWHSTPADESIVTVTFHADGGGTALTLRHDRIAAADSCDRHRYGWIGCLDRLDRLHADQGGMR